MQCARGYYPATEMALILAKEDDPGVSLLRMRKVNAPKLLQPEITLG